MATGKMIKPMAGVPIVTWTVPSIRASGRRTSSTGRALKLGLMVPHMRAATSKERNMEEAGSPGLTEARIPEISSTTTSRATVSLLRNLDYETATNDFLNLFMSCF